MVFLQVPGEVTEEVAHLLSPLLLAPSLSLSPPLPPEINSKQAHASPTPIMTSSTQLTVGAFHGTFALHYSCRLVHKYG